MHQAPRSPKSARGISAAAALVLTAAIFGCSIYANLAFVIEDPSWYRWLPPFTSVNANGNQHLGAEYFNIAQALMKGEGFANPFWEETGPTAWMPPVLPVMIAGMIWVSEGDRDTVMALFILAQVFTLVITGLLVLMLARRTTSCLGQWTSALVFFIFVISSFNLWFQWTHDPWIVLLAVDLVVAGQCLFRPYASKQTAIGWGVLGGFVAMINPIVAFAWGIMSVVLALRERLWRRFGIAVLCAGLTLLPWTVRNLIMFGRLLPVKSNAAYELWQSQCLQSEDGLLKAGSFGVHPYATRGRERAEYKSMGEIAYLDKKKELFMKALWHDPEDFLNRVADRFLGATIWYVPFNRNDASSRPVVTWMCRLLHALPFLGMLVLAYSAFFRPLAWIQWAVMGVYLLYLTPYIAISYYERYAIPLVGVKALLVVWAGDRLLALWRSWRIVTVAEESVATPAVSTQPSAAAVAALPPGEPT